MQNQEKVIAANKCLAELLGWTNLIDAGGALVGTPPDGAADSRGQAMVPNWAGDWAAAGPLMVARCLEVVVTTDASGAFIGSGFECKVCIEVHAQHASADAAVLYAIARAAIISLESRS